MKEIEVIRPGALGRAEPVPLRPEQAAEVAKLAAGARSPRTRRLYSWGWGIFERWCQLEGRAPLPADPLTVAAFVEAQANRVPAPAWSSVVVQLSAISLAHRTARLWSPTDDPALRDVLEGARRKLGTAAKRVKAPAAGEEIAAMVAAINRTTLAGKRDAAVLLVGFHTALRRSNLAALTVEDFAPVPGGLSVRVRRSKTDQAGAGAIIGLAEHGDETCPVAALRAWWEAAGITEGLAFRGFDFEGHVTDHFSAKTIERIVKRWAAAVGLKSEAFGGHSLRAGFVTEAIRRGAGDAEIIGTTLHTTPAMLAKYRREADPVRRGASGRMKGLGKRPT